MAHNYSEYGTDGKGKEPTRRGTPPASTPSSIGDQYSQYEDDVLPAGHTNRNVNPSNNANATAFGMGHSSNDYVAGGVTPGADLGAAFGAPPTGVITDMSSTLSSSTPGSVGDQYSHYGDWFDLAGYDSGDFYSLNSADPMAFETTIGSSSFVDHGYAFGAPAIGNTTTMDNSLSADTPRSLDNDDPYASGGVYGTRYPSVDPNPSNNAMQTDIGTSYGSSSNVSYHTAFGTPSTGAANTLSGTVLDSTFGPVGNPYLQHNDGFYPTGYSAVNPNLTNNILPTDPGTAPGSHSHATNDVAGGTASASNRNAANDTVLTAQFISNPPILRSTFSPSGPGPLAGPQGRARWPCTTCGKTFSRHSDVVRHAKRHGEELPYQYDAPDVNYQGSRRRDTLAKHKSLHKH